VREPGLSVVADVLQRSLANVHGAVAIEIVEHIHADLPPAMAVSASDWVTAGARSPWLSGLL
jgi:hypothetical protein